MTALIQKAKPVFALRWHVTPDTWVAFAAGFGAILLSVAMIPFAGTSLDWIAFTILRDFLMIFGLGFVLPVGYTLFVEKASFVKLGLTTDHWLLNVIISICVMGGFALMFSAQTPPEASLTFTPEALGAIVYIMVAGIFEMLFFYGFLQLRFERAFGTIPAIVLAAAFYSFHHAGFQPEFLKLFFVGVMYMSLFRTTRSLLILYPFAWGIGACWDVLVQFGMEVEVLRWPNALVVLGLMVLTGWLFAWRGRIVG